MAKERILVVEDEPVTLEAVRQHLTQEGYEVYCASTGEDALIEADSKQPDLVLLDLMLPGINGFEVCKNLKNNPKTSHIPIAMLTAKGEDADIVTSLELGADDYITKPFSPRVLIARVRSLLRRKKIAAVDETSVVKIHDIVINPPRFEILVKGRPVKLTVTEFGILHFLARHPGCVFTRSKIVAAVKGENYHHTTRTIDVQIVGLRKKLKSAGKYIETVLGVGYRFKD